MSGARRRAADGYRARGRRAGAVAVPHRTEELDQGRVVAGVGGRYRGQRPDRDAAAIAPRRIMAGCRKRAPTTSSVSASSWSGSSIRSTAPAAISPAAKTGASAWRWSRTPRRCWRRCSRRPATNSSSPRAGRAPRATMRAGSCDVRHRAGFFPHRRSEAAGRAAEPVAGRNHRFIPESDRWRCGCAGSRREGSMRPSPAAKAATGTLPRPI